MCTSHTSPRLAPGLRMFRSMRGGFTAIEGLLVVAMIAAVAGLSMPAYRTYQIRSDLDLATESIVQSLRRAQTLAQAGQDDFAWGVFIQEGTLFAGESYLLRAPSHDEVFVIPTTIDAYGLREVVYARLSGIPYETGSIFLVALNGEYREIVIDADGQMYVTGVQPHDPSLFTEEEEEEEEEEPEPEQYEYDDEYDDPNDIVDIEDCLRGYVVRGNKIYTLGTNDLSFRVIGSAATYGAKGPSMQVRVSLSLDDGETWEDLFGGNPVAAGQTQKISNVPQGASVVLRFNGRYSWLFNKTYQSDDGTGHVYVLQDGDPSPDYPIMRRIPSMAVFLRPIIHHVHRIVNVPSHSDILFLPELGNLDDTADFQDAAIGLKFHQWPHTCSNPDEPRVHINFLRLENKGEGDMRPNVFVGPLGAAFSERQWIPLMNDGSTIVDSGMVEDVPGLAFQRGPGWVRIHHHGSYDSPQSKQIVDAHILFQHAHITSVTNDEGVNETENPTDGIINDGPAGDEFVGGPTPQSMVYVTRVSQANDGVYLYWSQGSPPAGSGPAPGTSQNPVVQQPSDPEGDDDDNGGDGDEESPPDGTQDPEEGAEGAEPIDPEDDPCFVPYVVHTDGRIVLEEDADVRVRALGSYGTYGYLGPELQVRAQISFTNGTTFEPLFNYRRILGDEYAVFPDVPAGTTITMEYNGRYTWLFNRTERSGTSNPRVRVFQRGDAAPDTPTIHALTSLKPFLRSILSSSRTVEIGNREAAFLVELGQLDDTADYQDAVVVLSFDKPSARGTCASMTGEAGTQVPGGTNDAGQETEGDPSDPEAPHTTLPDLDGDGIPDIDDICAGTYMPESVPVEYMLFGRYALTANSPIFRVGPRKEISKYTLENTRGCSCGQLLDAIEGHNTYRFNEFPVLLRQMRSLFSFYVQSSRKFGCGEALMDMVSRGF